MTDTIISSATKEVVICFDRPFVIIGETEDDIRRYGHPLSDQVLAEALTKLEQAGARVIGVGLRRGHVCRARWMPIAYRGGMVCRMPRRRRSGPIRANT